MHNVYQQATAQSHRVLHNILVLDLTQALAGPYCTMLLGDMGADVIKIEPPRCGDQSRGWGPPFVDSQSTYFLAVNRNKRSLTLDLKTPEGREILRRLVARADVLVHNMPRLSSQRETGIDVETATTANPRLIYVAITGYGLSGPWAERPGYDMVAQAESGLMSITGEPEGEAMRFGIPLADMTTGIYAALGIVAALLAREHTGRGQVLDLSLLESHTAYLALPASALLNGGEPPRRVGNAHPSIVPYQLFKTRDKYITVAVGTQRLWERFCQVLGIEDTIMRDARFATNAARLQHRAELIPLLQEILLQRDAETWLEAFRAAQIPCGPINSVAEALAHPQLVERGFIVELEHPQLGVLKSLANPVHFSATPVTYRLPPPLLGEHTEAVLRDLGYTQSEIARFRADGVV
ncbi:MAG: formyl-CoA transferase [Ardenticatenia bacterium]|jgi:formyl-CoA transferase/CoA:oxalate CoA-transferase|nr:MAG: formyl-CoA transferase [Ardenticatenia bacterium]